MQQFIGRQKAQKQDVAPSSSPAFGTPQELPRFNDAPIRTILPVDLPPATLRPIAFRILTKKYGLTITATALQKLAVFIGRNCGSKWREGLAEGVLAYVAQRCKDTGRLIIDGADDQEYLPSLFKDLQPQMRGGKIMDEREQQLSLEGQAIPVRNAFPSKRPGGGGNENTNLDPRAYLKIINARDQPRLAYNVNSRHFDRVTSKPSLLPNPQSKTQLFRNRYNLIHQRLMRNEAFQQPTMTRAPPTLQRSGSSNLTQTRTHKLTPIANLLGRSGTSHLILGLLTISPTGTLALGDLTGSIALDLTHAQVSSPDAAWFVPGMIVLVDGIYEDEEITSANLGGGGGIGGTIGGRIIGTMVGTPLAEKRHVTLGTASDSSDGATIAGGGFGWTDFLGVGSEREKGDIMRELMARVFMPPPPLPPTRQPSPARVLGPSSDSAVPSSDAPTFHPTSSVTDPSSSRAGSPLPVAQPVTTSIRSKIAILGHLTLDSASTRSALTKILSHYAALPLSHIPLSFILLGPFTSLPALTLAKTSSVEYKDLFNALAAILGQYPILLANCTFVLVPGDNDAWASSFSAGAAGVLPLEPVPKMFTSRIAKAFAAANSEARKEGGGKDRVEGEAIWTSNPCRLSLFGPTHEMVLFRDDLGSRFRRATIRTAVPPSHIDHMEEDGATPSAEEQADPQIVAARKLTKTLLDQGHLSPFRLQDRPVLWDYAEALSLYPLPTSLVVCDPESGNWVMKYEGCTVINPGAVARESGVGGRRTAGWVEWDVKGEKGEEREVGW